MIIDTHTHVVPDKVAQKIAEISAAHFASAGMKLSGPMTFTGLIAAMKANSIDKARVFCVAEKPSVVRPSNEFLASHAAPEFILLGAVHPDTSDPRAEVDYLRQHGFKGIKFHSIFQDFYPDEDRLLRVYQEMGSNMVAYFHMGADPGAKDKEAKATPERLARVIKMFPKLKIVAAHFGGMFMIKEARKHLYGKDVYLDTCYAHGAQTLGQDQVLRIIKEHGSDKFLFASDYPFGEQGPEIRWIESLPLPVKDKENILFRNAARLFSVKAP